MRCDPGFFAVSIYAGIFGSLSLCDGISGFTPMMPAPACSLPGGPVQDPWPYRASGGTAVAVACAAVTWSGPGLRIRIAVKGALKHHSVVPPWREWKNE